LAGFTFVMAGAVSGRVFEGLPHLEDEIAYLFQARTFAGGRLVVDIPQDGRSFWQPFVIDHQPTGKRFGKYPPGWPALLALGVLIDRLWLINALLGAATLVLVYRVGSEVYHPDVGVIAALLTALSPAALLLNGTLMAHTSALFFATLFVWSFLRMKRMRRRVVWAAAAGGSLGALFAIRPLSAVAVAAPFLVWSCVQAVYQGKLGLRRIPADTGRAAAALVLAAALVASAIPVFNWAATGDPWTNLYRLVWSYDRLGFGDGRGRTGHTLEKGFRHARMDLSLTSADLFGWSFGGLTPTMVRYLREGASSWPGRGFSLLLLPFGVVVGLLAYGNHRGDRRLRVGLLCLWSSGAIYWVLLALRPHWFLLSPALRTDPDFGWVWVLAAMAWLLLPLWALVRWQEVPEIAPTWLLLSVVLGIVVLHLMYWTGSLRYSSRYYYEALAAASILTALPIVRLAQRTSRVIVYGLVVAVSVAGLLGHGLPRVAALDRLNGIDRSLIDGVAARRPADRQALVLVTGEVVRWQSYGALLAVTSPFLDGTIVAARDFGGGERGRISDRFRDRHVIEIQVSDGAARFVD
jgi:hypothetical protein